MPAKLPLVLKDWADVKGLPVCLCLARPRHGSIEWQANWGVLGLGCGIRERLSHCLLCQDGRSVKMFTDSISVFHSLDLADPQTVHVFCSSGREQKCGLLPEAWRELKPGQTGSPKTGNTAVCNRMSEYLNSFYYSYIKLILNIK